MMSVLAARHVDICLLPEMDINLDKATPKLIELRKDRSSYMAYGISKVDS